MDTDDKQKLIAKSLHWMNGSVNSKGERMMNIHWPPIRLDKYRDQIVIDAIPI